MKYGRTQLYYAAYKGHIEIVKLLIEKKKVLKLIYLIIMGGYHFISFSAPEN